MYTDIREFEKVLRKLNYEDLTIVLYVIDNRQPIEINDNCIYLGNVEDWFSKYVNCRIQTILNV